MSDLQDQIKQIKDGLTEAFAPILQYSNDAPMVEYTKVIRCKDCKFQAKCPTKIFGNHSDDWFCADGEVQSDERM